MRGGELRRFHGIDADSYDVATDEWSWLSGSERDGTDLRYRAGRPEVDEDALEAYEALFGGAPLPGRETG